MDEIPVARYLRQSQALNDDEAAILRQREATDRVVKARGLRVVEEFVDNDLSATKGARPGYRRMLSAWESGRFQGIVAYDLDRLYRLPRDLEDLIDLAEKRGLLLFTAAGDADLSTDNGRLFARIKAAVAKSEVERKSARQRLRNEQDAKEGRPYWRRRPFGYELDGTLREDEADAIRRGYSIMLGGGRVVDVRKLWTDEGFRTPRCGSAGGLEWSRNATREILLSPRNAAIRVWHDEEIPGTWQPIVDEVTFRTVRNMMKAAASARLPGGQRNAPISLLSGIARCGIGDCPGKIWASRSSSGKRVYRCYGGVFHLSRIADPVDEIVVEYIVNRLSRPDAAELLYSTNRPNAEALSAERERLRIEIEQLAQDHYVNNLVSRSVFLGTTKTLQSRLRELEGKMVHNERAHILGDLVKAKDVRALWENEDFSISRRRQVVSTLVDVVILPGRGRPVELVPREGA